MQQSKFQLILIGTFTAFIVIGVILFATTGKNASSKNAKLVVWGTIPQTTFLSVFSESPLSKSKNVSISYVEKTSEAFDLDFVNALAEGRGPDIIFLNHDSLLKSEKKLLVIPFESFSERAFKDTFVEGGELFLTPAGTLALPVTIDPLIMYWNRDIFTSAGLAGPPEFWDEYFKLSLNLTLKDGAFNITRATLALGEFQNINNAKEILSALLLQAGDPIVNRVNGVATSLLREKFDLPIAPAQAALSFYTEFSNSGKPHYSWNRSLPNSLDAFVAGDLAIYFGFASELSKLKLKNPNLNFDIKALPQSSNVREGERKITFGRMMGVAIVRNSKQIAPAFSTILEFSGPTMSKNFSQALFVSPARRDLLREWQGDSLKPVFYNSALWARGWLDPDYNETNRIFQNMVESVTGGRSKMETAINQASLALTELIRK